MFEHVGVGFYDVFFRKCAEALADDGVMLLHSIGRSEGPASPIRGSQVHLPRRLHPGALRGVAGVERAGLLVTDIEILRLHYAETLKHWRERFLAHRDDLPKDL
jgi:cyclopropane-fatty-acyl-phospholipid synthase